MCWNGKNQVLLRGSLDFSDYWFPSPVRHGDRSVGFRHGAHSLNSPSWLARCIRVGQLLLTEGLLIHLNFSPSMCSFYLSVYHYLFLYFSASFILSHLRFCQMSPHSSVEQHDFSRDLSWSSRETLAVRCGDKSHKRCDREKRVGPGKKNKGEKDISTLESTT